MSRQHHEKRDHAKGELPNAPASGVFGRWVQHGLEWEAASLSDRMQPDLYPIPASRQFMDLFARQ